MINYMNIDHIDQVIVIEVDRVNDRHVDTRIQVHFREISHSYRDDSMYIH